MADLFERRRLISRATYHLVKPGKYIPCRDILSTRRQRFHTKISPRWFHSDRFIAPDMRSIFAFYDFGTAFSPPTVSTSFRLLKRIPRHWKWTVIMIFLKTFIIFQQFLDLQEGLPEGPDACTAIGRGAPSTTLNFSKLPVAAALGWHYISDLLCTTLFVICFSTHINSQIPHNGYLIPPVQTVLPGWCRCGLRCNKPSYWFSLYCLCFLVWLSCGLDL